MQATPQTDTVSPVTESDFAEYLGVESDDPLLPGILVAATDAAISFMQRDLLTRTWVAVITPPAGQSAQLSPYRPVSVSYDLPYTTGTCTVDSVVDAETGEDIDYTAQAWRRPVRIVLTGWSMAGDAVVTYSTGSESVPEAIKQGIMALAAYLYEHRGGCDAADAIAKSGARGLLAPYRVCSL